MKLLLCVNRFSDFSTLLEGIAVRREQLPDPSSANFIHSTHYLGHEIDICETGFGIFQTTFKITKTLSQKRYHLALKASFCNAYKADLQIGDVVNVIKDKPGDIGMTEENGFKDIYDLGLMNAESFPHFKGAFINMNNSYMNVLMPFRKVVSVTVNQYADVANYPAKQEKYKADIETGDGLGFVYPCMYERQPFYQLNVVERNLATGDYDFEKAKVKLNETILDILQKL
jgi:futalosine hydrolase